MSKLNTIKIINDFIPLGRRNRPGRVNSMKFITIHNTGNTSRGSGAKNHASFIKSDAAANVPVSWHYTTDEKDIIQHLPDNESAFHAGDGVNGTGNTQSIGIEICMNSDGDLKGATDNGALITAHLCIKYNISIQNIVQHHRWNSKNCPKMLRSSRPYDWNVFINKVRSFIDTYTQIITCPPVTASSCALKVTDVRFRVQVGAFRDLKNAEKLFNDLKRQGFITIISPTGPLHRVQVGEFYERVGVEKLLARCKVLGYNEAFIVSLPEATYRK